mgnify:CR=1 FL=1
MLPHRTRGVALVVENPHGEIIILQEFETKSRLGKYAGMFSIPMETSYPGEDDRSALGRLIAEELPGVGAHIEVWHPRIGVYRIVPRVWVSLYRARLERVSLPAAASTRAEVGNHAWLTPQKAVTLWLRQGAREMLSDCLHGRHGVVCRRCAPPPPVTPDPSLLRRGP